MTQKLSQETALATLDVDHEEWRYLPHIGLLVSSLGYVMPLPQAGCSARPTRGLWDEKEGRFVVSNKQAIYKVARLICEAFHGPAPLGKNVAMHVDENSANNAANNLQWGSQSENLKAPQYVEYARRRQRLIHKIKNASAEKRMSSLDRLSEKLLAINKNIKS